MKQPFEKQEVSKTHQHNPFYSRELPCKKEVLSSSKLKIMDHGYNYVLENEKYPGKYKIGKTISKIGLSPMECIEKRIKTYQTGTDGKLKVVFYIETPFCRRSEKLTHIMLSKYNCHYGGGTEWFENISLSLIQEIMNYIVQSYDFIDYESTLKCRNLIFLPSIYESNGAKPMMIDYDFLM